jgi:hypothetical protein
MLNRCLYRMLLTLVEKISYCYVLYEKYHRQPNILVFILLSLLTVDEKKEENKRKKAQICHFFE